MTSGCGSDSGCGSGFSGGPSVWPGVAKGVQVCAPAAGSHRKAGCPTAATATLVAA
ncbi:MAG: hypothetical protein R3F14_29335 [Polyangiaceae bacterium]